MGELCVKDKNLWSFARQLLALGATCKLSEQKDFGFAPPWRCHPINWP